MCVKLPINMASILIGAKIFAGKYENGESKENNKYI